MGVFMNIEKVLFVLKYIVILSCIGIALGEILYFAVKTIILGFGG